MSLLLLHRYVLKEFLIPFVIGLAVFTFLFLLNHLFWMIDLFLNRGVGLLMIVKLMGLVLPMILPISIPMASLLGALLCYSRLSESGELTVLRSAGLTLLQYSWPNFLLGLLLSIFLVHFNLNVAPRATRKFKTIHYEITQHNPLALFAPKMMNQFGEYKIIVEEMDRKRRKLTGVSIYKVNSEGTPTRIFAPEGEVTAHSAGGLTIQLSNGSVHYPNHNQGSQFAIVTFERLALQIPAKIRNKPRSLSLRELNYSELQEKIQDSIRKNQNPIAWQTEKNLRVAIAFSTLIFIFLGTVLGVELKKGAKAFGIGMGLVVSVFYYGLLILAISLSSQGLFSPLVLTWSPNLATFLVGGFLWYQRSTQ